MVHNDMTRAQIALTIPYMLFGQVSIRTCRSAGVSKAAPQQRVARTAPLMLVI
jgi:hypothetical protein